MTEFNADPTSSNKTGVTLMDNQVGHVVAEVIRGKENVTVTVLPSMIRVDGIGKVDFEEIMTTHYGRMVVLDDRILFFANPEDAAEYIGFDLQQVR
jgi:propane monooxygenase coupling protein